MKKERRNGVIYLTSEKQSKFISPATAIMAMETMQMLFALQGYLTTSSTNIEYGRVELFIHFEEKPYPTLPQGYKYTWRQITSHTYWDDMKGQQERVRCVDYYFEFNR